MRGIRNFPFTKKNLNNSFHVVRGVSNCHSSCLQMNLATYRMLSICNLIFYVVVSVLIFIFYILGIHYPTIQSIDLISYHLVIHLFNFLSSFVSFYILDIYFISYRFFL